MSATFVPREGDQPNEPNKPNKAVLFAIFFRRNNFLIRNSSTTNLLGRLQEMEIRTRFLDFISFFNSIKEDYKKAS